MDILIKLLSIKLKEEDENIAKKKKKSQNGRREEKKRFQLSISCAFWLKILTE